MKATLICLITCLSAALALPAAPDFNPRTRVCEMSAIARDFYSRAPEHFYHCRDTATNQLLDLAFPPDSPAHKDIFTGDTAEVEGDDDGKTITVRTYKMLARNPDFAPGRRTRRAVTTRSAMVIVLRFNNNGAFVGAALDTTQERAAVANTVNNTLFGVYDSNVKLTHAGMWNDCSYGALTLGYDIDGVANDFAADYPGSNADIFYVDVPYTCTAGVGFCTQTYNTGTACGTAEYYGWPEFALNFLTANRPGFDRNRWQHKVIIYPSGTGIACNFIGQGNTACSSSYCYSWFPQDYVGYVQDYSHEMGHNLGLAHAGDTRSTATNYPEYGDFSCAMGFCCSTRCYNAPHAAELGWLTPILTLSSASIANQVSVQQTVASMSVSSRGAILVNCDWCTTPSQYWVQLKTADNYDRFGSSSWLNNVQIKRWNGGGYERTDHIWTGTAGQTWDEASGLLHITVNTIDLVAKTATVTIKRGSADPCAGVVCVAIDQCHTAGTCNPLTGTCSNPVKADGSSCTDGNACTAEMCVAGTCAVQSVLSGCCGNGRCEAGESCSSCAADCISGSGSNAVCGNGRCEVGDGENCLNCAADCNGVTSGKTTSRYCCGSDVSCGDSRCSSNGRTCSSASSGFSYCCGDNTCLSPYETSSNCYDCQAPVCGDGVCNSGESCSSCAVDCGACPFCGDGVCNSGESCSSCVADCGACPFCGDGRCNNGESCSTCASDCGACAPFCGDGVCNNGETCSTCSKDCGACPCGAVGSACTSNSQCCSNKCSTAKKTCQ